MHACHGLCARRTGGDPAPRRAAATGYAQAHPRHLGRLPDPHSDASSRASWRATAISIFIGDYVESLGSSASKVRLAGLPGLLRHLHRHPPVGRGRGPASFMFLIVTAIAVAALLIFTLGAFADFDSGSGLDRASRSTPTPGPRRATTWLPFRACSAAYSLAFPLGDVVLPRRWRAYRSRPRRPATPRRGTLPQGLIALLVGGHPAGAGPAHLPRPRPARDGASTTYRTRATPSSRRCSAGEAKGDLTVFPWPFPSQLRGARQPRRRLLLPHLPRLAASCSPSLARAPPPASSPLTTEPQGALPGRCLVPGAPSASHSRRRPATAPRMLNVAVFGATISSRAVPLSHIVLRRTRTGASAPPYRTPGGVVTSSVASRAGPARRLVATFLVDEDAAFIALGVYAVAPRLFQPSNIEAPSGGSQPPRRRSSTALAESGSGAEDASDDARRARAGRRTTASIDTVLLGYRGHAGPAAGQALRRATPGPGGAARGGGVHAICWWSTWR